MAAALPPLQLPQNYQEDCEATVNAQIQLQLNASYMHLSMAVYCRRADVALKNFSRFFLRRSHQWRQLAKKLMCMQSERGGRVTFGPVTQPVRSDWCGGFRAMQLAFQLENTVNQSLLELRQLATNKSDPTLCDFLQCHYLQPQGPVLYEMGEHLARLRGMRSQGAGPANYDFESFTLR